MHALWLALAAAIAQPECPTGALRAYAHNDYLNARPLVDALRLGYRGVEADVFLVDGQLRLGHDHKAARRGPTLELTYLDPLEHIVARCGRVLPDRLFLLTVELKEQSRATFDSLIVTLDRHPDLLKRHVNVVLVGWHPTGETHLDLFGPQYRIATTDTSAIAPIPGTRLISLDYGKTAGRWWRTPAGRRRWVEMIGVARRRAPGAWVRAYNIPSDSTIYRRLWEAGVDLVGIKGLPS